MAGKFLSNKMTNLWTGNMLEQLKLDSKGNLEIQDHVDKLPGVPHGPMVKTIVDREGNVIGSKFCW